MVLPASGSILPSSSTYVSSPIVSRQQQHESVPLANSAPYPANPIPVPSTTRSVPATGPVHGAGVTPPERLDGPATSSAPVDAVSVFLPPHVAPETRATPVVPRPAHAGGTPAVPCPANTAAAASSPVLGDLATPGVAAAPSPAVQPSTNRLPLLLRQKSCLIAL
jgi:hypothetical protein